MGMVASLFPSVPYRIKFGREPPSSPFEAQIWPEFFLLPFKMDIESEYAESSTLLFEWTLKGLKSMFDSTKGDKKSKVTKSVKFGSDKWQVGARKVLYIKGCL